MEIRPGSPIQHRPIQEQSSSWGIVSFISSIVEKILRSIFFMGFRELDERTVRQRNFEIQNKLAGHRMVENLENHGDVEITYFLGAVEKRQNTAVIFASTKYYQDIPFSYYEHFLKSGTDVILWNPPEKDVHSYASILEAIIRRFKSEEKLEHIAVFSYCVTVQMAISAAHALDDENICHVIDRGFGDASFLAVGATSVARLPCLQSFIREKFDCGAIDKIGELKGNALFIYPPEGNDQVMDRFGGNHTRDLMLKREGRVGDESIILENGHHWTAWDYETWEKVQRFLSKNRVLGQSYEPVDAKSFPKHEAPSCWSTNVRWWLTKSPCGCQEPVLPREKRL